MTTKEFAIVITGMNQDRVKCLVNQRVDFAIRRLEEIIGEEPAENFLKTPFGKTYLNAAHAGMHCILNEIPEKPPRAAMLEITFKI